LLKTSYSHIEFLSPHKHRPISGTKVVSKGAKLDTKDRFGQTPLIISLSILTRGIGTDRRLQIPRIYRKETAELLLKLGAAPLDRSGVDVVLQRHGDLATQ
jgi:hypothetical protein